MQKKVIDIQFLKVNQDLLQLKYLFTAEKQRASKESKGSKGSLDEFDDRLKLVQEQV